MRSLCAAGVLLATSFCVFSVAGDKGKEKDKKDAGGKTKKFSVEVTNVRVQGDGNAPDFVNVNDPTMKVRDNDALNLVYADLVTADHKVEEARFMIYFEEKTAREAPLEAPMGAMLMQQKGTSDTWEFKNAPLKAGDAGT